MKYIKTLTHFIWTTHIYFFVLYVLFMQSSYTTDLLGYTGGFISVTLMVFGLMMVFRMGLRVSELFIPLTLYLGFIFLFINYFYLSGRTDMYWFAIYCAVFSAIETTRFIYKEKYIPEKLAQFSLVSYVFAGILSLGVWFFLYDFTTFSDQLIVSVVLTVYAGTGIMVEGSQVLCMHSLISRKQLNLFLSVLGVVFIVLTATSLFTSYLFQGIV